MNNNIKRYNEYINEMILSDMDDKTRKVMLYNMVEKLDEYKEYILSNIKVINGEVIYKEFDRIDINVILREMNNAFGVDFISDLNLIETLNKINDIMGDKELDIKKKISALFYDFKNYLFSK